MMGILYELVCEPKPDIDDLIFGGDEQQNSED